MEFEAKQINKVPEVLTAALFFCAMVCVVFGGINGIKYRGILQSAALVFFCAMIYVLVKYKFTRVRYTVRKKPEKGYGDEDGESVGDNSPVLSCPPSELQLLIETAQGKRTFVGAALADLEKIKDFGEVPMVKAEKKSFREKYKKLNRYKYLKNMVGAKEYYLVAGTELGDVLIVFEPGEKMAGYLSAVARYNKETRD